jgi:hypothetical protein
VGRSRIGGPYFRGGGNRLTDDELICFEGGRGRGRPDVLADVDNEFAKGRGEGYLKGMLLDEASFTLHRL